MKRCLVLVIFLLVPFVLAETLVPPVPSKTWVSEEKFVCDTCCIENEKFSLTTTITNNGTETLWISNAYLVDKNGKEFASYKARDPNFMYGLEPKKSINLKYEGTWSKPSFKNSLFYKQCLSLGYLKEVMCEEEYKEKVIAISVEFQCYKDEDCPFDYICNIEYDCTSSTCEKIKIASQCGRIVRGKWRPYECCSDQECAKDQRCLDNNCEKVECTCGYVQNHKCVKFGCCEEIDCGQDETCVSNKCLKLECEYCEYADKHQCNKHDCCSDQECEDDKSCVDNKCLDVVCEKGYVEKHTCFKHQCVNDEDCRADLKCEDNFCTKLKCEEYEVIRDHKCEKSKSMLLGYVKDHRYVSYLSVEAYEYHKTLYLSLTVLIVALMITLSVLKIKHVIKEKKWESSYLLIKPKKKAKQ